MCGVCGFLRLNRDRDADTLRTTALNMTDTLVHRGPDVFGVWADASAGVALGHRRLSVVDFTPTGKQPMLSACGRFVIICNGEIYNFRELRQELKGLGCTFRGHSDTEVLLSSISRCGVQRALERVNGMLAFALWDRSEHTLTLARDRLGKKTALLWLVRRHLFVFLRVEGPAGLSGFRP